MPQNNQHPFDEVSDEILQWLVEEPEYYVEMLRGGHQAPFSADVSEQDKLEYYRRQVFQQNPNGTVNYDQPNSVGRDMLIKRVGVKGYTDIMAAVMPKQGMRPMLPEQDEPEMQDSPAEESSESY